MDIPNAKLEMNLSLDSVSGYLKHLPKFSCPLCNGNDFSITTLDGKNAEIFAPSGILFDDMSQRTIKEKNTLQGMYIQVICNRCGHVSNLNYWRLFLNIRNKTTPTANESA